METIKRNLGGDRLKSGNKMQVEMHGYNRSTHDLSYTWRSSMACGTLVPCFKKIALNGDTWKIDINAIAKTIPTIGPLFGSFKMQVDFFCVPLRLYNAKLHNNPIGVGTQMAQIPLQHGTIKHYQTSAEVTHDNFNKNCQINPSSLMHYLGLKGLGVKASAWVEKDINTIPILAYYDIFKNYYANKQEDWAYFIGHENDATTSDYFINNIINTSGYNNKLEYEINAEDNETNWLQVPASSTIIIYYNGDLQTALEDIILSVKDADDTVILNAALTEIPADNIKIRTTERTIELTILQAIWSEYNSVKTKLAWTNATYDNTDIQIQSFRLSTLDKVREDILAGDNKNLEKWGDESYFAEMTYNALPDFLNVNIQDDDDYKRSKNVYTQYGLLLKTYQADLYNNWINKETIDSQNGITAVTTIDTSDGLNLDILNLYQKVYNMLNRVVASGNTYEDWQEVQYAEKAIRRAETPMYIGGADFEISFEEITSSAETSIDNNNKALGTLAGKGTIINKSGGNIDYKIEEPSYIIGICSITPRIDYADGNDWDITRLKNFGELHVPALDGIGFEDLMEEQAAWYGYGWTEDDGIWHENNNAIGKVPAWINYMTANNEVHGDFADDLKAKYMVLERNYEPMGIGGGINDVTSYIDPTKYNYCFAYQGLDSQNFWIQIKFDVTARRKMSAKIIPSL